MDNRGYVKLHRSIVDWGWYSDANTARVFIHLLLTANYEESEYLGHKIPAGSVVVGYSALAQQTNLSVQNVRTAISHLKSTGELTVKVTNKFSIVTIANWGRYQLCESKANSQTNSQANKQLTFNQHSTNKQLTASKEIKKVRNKEIKKYIYSAEPKLEEAITDFIALRKQMKKPMTDKAVKLLISRLEKMSSDTDEQVAMLNQSIERGWLTVYELKEPIKAKKGEKVHDEWDTELG